MSDGWLSHGCLPGVTPFHWPATNYILPRLWDAVQLGQNYMQLTGRSRRGRLESAHEDPMSHPSSSHLFLLWGNISSQQASSNINGQQACCWTLQVNRPVEDFLHVTDDPTKRTCRKSSTGLLLWRQCSAAPACHVTLVWRFSTGLFVLHLNFATVTTASFSNVTSPWVPPFLCSCLSECVSQEPLLLP